MFHFLSDHLFQEWACLYSTILLTIPILGCLTCQYIYYYIIVVYAGRLSVYIIWTIAHIGQSMCTKLALLVSFSPPHSSLVISFDDFCCIVTRIFAYNHTLKRMLEGPEKILVHFLLLIIYITLS